MLAPGTTFADYVIDAEIGSGGMSIVYRARERFPDRVVALKVLDPRLALDAAFRERFLAEPNLAAAIGHPNIIPIFDSGEADGQLFIAMPLVEGADLDALIRREGWLRLGRAASIVDQTARALAAAHRAGMVHRDIKPANVLLVPAELTGGDEHVYLADFGLAKRTATPSKLTREAFMGTREYAAPEQIRSEPVDARTDVYALGCVVYECLTGSPPFAAEDDVALIYAHLEKEPPRVTDTRADLPEAVDALVAAAMDKHMENRPSVLDLARGLAAQAATVGDREAPPPGEARRARGRAATEIDV